MDILKEAEEHRKTLQQEVEEAEILDNLTKQRGWKIVDEELCARLVSAGKQLRRAIEPMDIYRAQGEMDAIEKIINYIPSRIEYAKEARKELENL